MKRLLFILVTLCLLGLAKVSSPNECYALTLGEALDSPSVQWTGSWNPQSGTSYFGGSAAQSAAIGNGGSTSLSATFTRQVPTNLKFYWKVSSESCCDYLAFYVDGVMQFNIRGEVGWEQKTVVIQPGTHTISWTYSKDGSLASGSDAGWVDKVEGFDSIYIVPLSTNYSNVSIGSSAKQTFSFNNYSTGSRNVGQLAITGANASDFNLANDTCSNKLVTNANCSVDVNFVPTAKGARSATLNVSFDATSLTAALTGTGVTTITGSITDLSTGNKLAAATVTITGGATIQTDTQGGFIFLTPPANGVYTVTITKAGYSTATYNNVIISDTAGATLNVGMAPSGILNFTTASGPLYHAETGTAYNQSAKITGGAGPYIFTKAYGTLPPGLTIDSAIGTISGTPSTATFNVMAPSF